MRCSNKPFKHAPHVLTPTLILALSRAVSFSVRNRKLRQLTNLRHHDNIFLDVSMNANTRNVC